MNDRNPNEPNPYGGYSTPPPYDQRQPPDGQQRSPYTHHYGMGNTGDTSMGLTENRGILLSYSFWWITGLIVFFVEKKNRLVRFHAMQSILVFGAASISLFVFNQISWIAPYLFFLASNLVWLAAGALWLYLLFNAWQGHYIKLPFFGDYAEKFTN